MSEKWGSVRRFGNLYGLASGRAEGNFEALETAVIRRAFQTAIKRRAWKNRSVIFYFQTSGCQNQNFSV